MPVRLKTRKVKTSTDASTVLSLTMANQASGLRFFGIIRLPVAGLLYSDRNQNEVMEKLIR